LSSNSCYTGINSARENDVRLHPVDPNSGEKQVSLSCGVNNSSSSNNNRNTNGTAVGSKQSPTYSPNGSDASTHAHGASHLAPRDQIGSPSRCSLSSTIQSAAHNWTSTAMALAAAAAVAVAASASSSCPVTLSSQASGVEPSILGHSFGATRDMSQGNTVKSETDSQTTNSPCLGRPNMSSEPVLAPLSSPSVAKRTRLLGPDNYFVPSTASFPAYGPPSSAFRQQPTSYEYGYSLAVSTHNRNSTGSMFWSGSSGLQSQNPHLMHTPVPAMQSNSILGSAGRHSMTDYPVFPGLRDNGANTIPTVTSPQGYCTSTPPPPRRSVSLTAPFPSTALNSDTGSYVVVPGTSGPLSHLSSPSSSATCPNTDLIPADSFGTVGMSYGHSEKTCTDMSHVPVCTATFSIGSTSISTNTNYGALCPNSVLPDFLDPNPSSTAGSHMPNDGTVDVDRDDGVDAEEDEDEVDDDDDDEDEEEEDESDDSLHAGGSHTSGSDQAYGSKAVHSAIDESDADSYDDDDEEDEDLETGLNHDRAATGYGSSSGSYTEPYDSRRGSLDHLKYSGTSTPTATTAPNLSDVDMYRTPYSTKRPSISLVQMFAVSVEHDDKLGELVEQFVPQIKSHLEELVSMKASLNQTGTPTVLNGSRKTSLTEDTDSSGATPSDAKLSTPEPAYGHDGTGMGQLISDSATSDSNVTPLATSSAPSVTVGSRSYLEQLKSSAILAPDPETHPSDSAEKAVLATTTEYLMCSLCCLLENCLFYLVDWMGQTELFKIIPVADKMQLLNSSWSEIVLLEYLHCYLTHCSDGGNGPPAIVSKSPAHCNRDGTNTMRLSSSASLRPSRELCEVMDGTVDWLLGGTEFRSKLEDLLAQFERLQLDHEEFTCLKFLALFNPAKHDMALNSSQDYVRRVQGRLCRFLLRRSRLASRVMLTSSNKNATHETLPQWIPHSAVDVNAWKSASTDRFGRLLLQLAEVKYVAFQMESHLLARYRIGKIPHESLLTEMLVTKRNGLHTCPGNSTRRFSMPSKTGPSDQHPRHSPPPSSVNSHTVLMSELGADSLVSSSCSIFRPVPSTQGTGTTLSLAVSSGSFEQSVNASHASVLS
ncbi:Nuclear receptor subfamily 5 group A member 2, partial [Fasciolopsis buskii]